MSILRLTLNATYRKRVPTQARIHRFSVGTAFGLGRGGQFQVQVESDLVEPIFRSVDGVKWRVVLDCVVHEILVVRADRIQSFLDTADQVFTKHHGRFYGTNVQD